MKLVRFGEPGREAPGLIDSDGTLRDLTGIVPDIAGSTLSDSVLDTLRARDHATLPSVAPGTRLGACVGQVGKLIAIGLNYADHAAEAGMDLPPEPVVFMKATSAISGPNDPLVLPRGSTATDWEVELAVVIGTRAKHVSEERALGHVAGYCILNDISERDHQLRRSGQWVKGKSHDGFAPLGPWLVTRDEVPDPQALDMTLRVNDRVMQNGSTRTMHVPVARLVAYLSDFMTLHPGDVITTGTPPGVGMGQSLQVYLAPGDVMIARVSGLGEQRQEVRAAPLT